MPKARFAVLANFFAVNTPMADFEQPAIYTLDHTKNVNNANDVDVMSLLISIITILMLPMIAPCIISYPTCLVSALAFCSPGGHKESDTTEGLNLLRSTSHNMQCQFNEDI